MAGGSKASAAGGAGHTGRPVGPDGDIGGISGETPLLLWRESGESRLLPHNREIGMKLARLEVVRPGGRKLVRVVWGETLFIG